MSTKKDFKPLILLFRHINGINGGNDHNIHCRISFDDKWDEEDQLILEDFFKNKIMVFGPEALVKPLKECNYPSFFISLKIWRTNSNIWWDFAHKYEPENISSELKCNLLRILWEFIECLELNHLPDAVEKIILRNKGR